MSILIRSNWEMVSEGVYKISLKGKSPRLLKYAHPPRHAAINKMTNYELPFLFSEIRIENVGMKSVFTLPLKENENIFGLGLGFNNVNQRGQVRHLRMDHYSSCDTGRSHAACPMYVSDNGYAVLVDTAECVSVYVGTSTRVNAKIKPLVRDRNTDPLWDPIPDSRTIEISFLGESADIYIFAGPTPIDAVSRYNLYCGGGCMPPKWGLGIWHRMHTNANEEMVIEEVEEFHRRGYPIDVIGLEPGWQSASYPCTYDWDKTRFPDPLRFCKKMKEMEVHINLWEDPYISPKSHLYEEMKPFSGSHLVWGGLVPDYTLSKTREILKSHHKEEHIKNGVSGYKLDECDGFDFYLWPDHAEFPSGVTGIEMRQLYPLLLQKTIDELMRENDIRTYGLIRASNSGSSAYPYVIYSDCYKFDEFLTGLINSSFIGQLWVPEVRSADTSEEWVRRFQLVCFSPIAMLDAWFTGLKPWSFEDVKDIIKDVMNMRKIFLPYLYSAFAKYFFEGVPPFRALHLDYDLRDLFTVTRGVLNDNENPYPKQISEGVKDQFLFGDSIMVAPMAPEQKSRSIIFPGGDWFDFYTGVKIETSLLENFECPLDKIPLFVKDGGIIPLFIGEDIEIRYYGTKQGEFTLYDDNGIDFNYEKGEYSLCLIKAKIEEGKAIFSEDIIYNGFGETIWGNHKYIRMNT